MISRNQLSNKLEPAWRKYAPGGKRPKLIKIPFKGVMDNNLRAMGTKRTGVLPNRLFSRRNSSAIFSMSTMSNVGSFSSVESPLSAMNNPSFDNEVNPAFYKDPIDYRSSAFDTNPDYDTPRTTDAKLKRLQLQQELQDLKRERLAESRELQDLRERDLRRKRIADTRKSYRAYVLDTSKETRGWLREAQGNAKAAQDTARLINELRI